METETDRTAQRDDTRAAILREIAEITNGAWHHVVGVYDGAKLTLYITRADRSDAPSSRPVWAQDIPDALQ